MNKRLYKSCEIVTNYYEKVGLFAIHQGQLPIGSKIELRKYDSRDFSQMSKTNLPFLRNAYLGDEQMIMFKEKDIKENI